MGPVGLGQVDADAHPGRARQADERHRDDRGRADHVDGRQRAHAPAPPAHRVRLPVLQPAPDADGGGEHQAAALGRRARGRPGLVQRARSARSGSPTGCGHRPAELSGGQQQRVAVARSLVARPTVVFADEPTGNLDTSSSAEILALLRELSAAYGQTIVMVTHDPRAAAIADRILYLLDGQIVLDRRGATEAEILKTMNELDTLDRGVREAPMLRVTLKDLLGRKLRLALTSLAIVLGVGMVSGTYVLTDTINAGIEVAPRRRLRERRRGRDRQGGVRRDRRARARLRSRPRRWGGSSGFPASRPPAATSGRGREIVGTNGKVDLARRRSRVRLQHRPRLRALHAAAARRGQLADRRRARSRSTPRPPTPQHLAVGEPRRRHRQGRTRAALHGHRDRRLRQLDLARRRDALGLRPPDGADAVRQAGRARPDRRRRQAGRRGPRRCSPRSARCCRRTPRCAPGRQQAQAEVNDYSSALLDTFRYFLLAFGGIALFVGAFVIANTLSITVAQRDARVRDAADARRELAPGAPRGDARGARDRARRLGDRAVRRARPRQGARGALQGRRRQAPA